MDFLSASDTLCAHHWTFLCAVLVIRTVVQKVNQYLKNETKYPNLSVLYLCCGIMHNLRNPRCRACTKWRARQSDRPLKSCHIDHLLWNHNPSLTSLTGTLTDHFSVENDQCSLHNWHDRDDRRQSVMCTEEAYRGSYRTYRANMSTRLSMAMHICRQTESISVHLVDMHTCTKRICWHPQINSMDVISSTPMRRGSSAEPFPLLHITSNSSAHCTKNQSHVHSSAA
jgi:hypothetical protein